MKNPDAAEVPDQPETEVSFDAQNDPHPERSSVNADHLAHLHGISVRTIQRLVAAGKLTQRPDGRFNRRTAIDELVAYQLASKKPQSQAGERLDRTRTRMLERRLDREAKNEITMTEALGAVDHVTNAFNIALDEIGRQVADLVEDPARAALAVRHTKTDLNKSFGRHRHRLVTGRWPE